MKMLTKAQIQRKDEITTALNQVSEEIRDETNRFNAQMSHLFSPIEGLQQRHNELIGEANAFLEEVHQSQEVYQGERSVSWQDGENGQSHKAWAAEWEVTVNEIDVVCPEPIEEPDMDAAETLRELPDHP